MNAGGTDKDVRMVLDRIRAAIGRGEEIPGVELRELIRQTGSEDPSTARQGLKALFPGLIEWLNDSFTPAAAGYYTQLFSQVIDHFRSHPAGDEFDRQLQGFGLNDQESILHRFKRLEKGPVRGSIAPERLRRAIFLSRVTIGADVAVTSVLIDGLRRMLPDPARVEIVLLGSGKLRELYGGDSGIRVREVRYERGGTMLARLMSWREVIAAVEDEISGLERGEYLVIDPDSRLTQLGLLPVLPPELEPQGYRFFPSRVFTSPGCSSLGELAAAWVDGEGGGRSFVALPDRYVESGGEVVRRLRGLGARRIVTVSLGVGGNPEKSAGEDFEIALLRRLSRRSWVILDRGLGASEQEQVERVISPLRAAGIPILTAGEGEDWEIDLAAPAESGILTWQGGIGSLAGLIMRSDRYVGYDSSGQHLAAAIGVPALTIFISGNPPVFAERWAPFGQRSRVIRMKQPEIKPDAE